MTRDLDDKRNLDDRPICVDDSGLDDIHNRNSVLYIGQLVIIMRAALDAYALFWNPSFNEFLSRNKLVCRSFRIVVL